MGRGGDCYNPGCDIIDTWREHVVIGHVYEVVKVVVRLIFDDLALNELSLNSSNLR